jgi:glycerophosphoryl diester phosphodiesterase
VERTRLRDWLTARPIAHRGLHEAAAGVIENTASAFQAAIDGNYGIECDLQMSADGEAMVHHDEALGRLTDGDARLDWLPAAALRQVAYKGTADRMLMLGELCELVAGRVTLVLELKSRFDGDARLPQRVCSALQGYKGPVAAMSFDPAMLAALRGRAPWLPRGLVAMKRAQPAEGSDRVVRPTRFAMRVISARLNFLAYRVQDLPTALPSLARNVLRLPLLAWTVRTPPDRIRAGHYADQIIFEDFRP